MQSRDLEPNTLEQLASARQELQAYRDDGAGYLLRHGILVTDPAEIAHVKHLIYRVDHLWTLLDAGRGCRADLERGSRLLH